MHSAAPKESGLPDRESISAGRAFSLIELLVVMAIIAALSGIGVGISRYVTWKSRQTQHDLLMIQIRSGLDEYKSIYGEYPIAPSTSGVYVLANTRKHYKEDLVLPENGSGIATGTLNLAINTIETATIRNDKNVAGRDEQLTDWSLVYPLTVKQLQEGGRPLVEFKQELWFSCSYKEFQASDIIRITNWYIKKSGEAGSEEYEILKTYPVFRYQAIDPISGKQFHYECENGQKYEITTNAF